MISVNSYVPANNMYIYKISWVMVDIDMPYSQICSSGIIQWCVDNLEGKWSLLKQNVIAFEYGEEALLFKMKFIIK